MRIAVFLAVAARQRPSVWLVNALNNVELTSERTRVVRISQAQIYEFAE
jgi:hypothetical protein